MIANIHEAKSQLSKLIERALAGEDVVISKAGQPQVRLVPVEPTTQPRKDAWVGSMKGKIWMAPDFNETDPELIDLMENGPIFPPER